MRKFLVCSDIHGRIDRFRSMLENEPAADLYGILIAGDIESDPGKLTEMIYMGFPGYSNVRIYMVRGNCDYLSCGLGESLMIEAGYGHRILLTHGHRTGVKRDLLTLAAVASNQEADIAVYGHTHEACDEIVNGIRCINPGALCGGYFSGAGYAVISVDDEGVRVEYKKL